MRRFLSTRRPRRGARARGGGSGRRFRSGQAGGGAARGGGGGVERARGPRLNPLLRSEPQAETDSIHLPVSSEATYGVQKTSGGQFPPVTSASVRTKTPSASPGAQSPLASQVRFPVSPGEPVMVCM